MFQLTEPDEIKAAVNELVKADVWTKDLHGYTLPSFIAANRTRAEVETDRAKTRERVRNFRKRQKGGR